MKDKEIPMVETYKYFSFIVDKNGIDFVNHIKYLAEWGLAFLKFLQVQCFKWSPYIRFLVYNTFLRSKLDYGAPLVNSFIKTKEILNPIQQLENSAIAWIFNSSVIYSKVL